MSIFHANAKQGGIKVIYKNVQKLCKRKHTNIAAVESACGIGNGTIGKWKDGERTPNLNTVIKIADYFGVSVDDLIKGGRKRKSKTPA